MISALYRSLAGPPPAPPFLVERDSRAFSADLAADLIGGQGIAPPDTEEEFQRAFEDLVVVYRCATLNADAISAAVLRFYRHRPNGEREELTERDDPLLALFRRPNPRMSGRRFLWMVQVSKELTGNAFVEVVPRPLRQLWVMNSAKVHIQADARKGVTGYDYKPSYSHIERFKPSEVWHDWFPTPTDELRGMPPLRPAWRHKQSDEMLERGMNKILSNGMRLSGVLTVDREISKDSATQLIDQLRTLYSGVANWGKTLVVAGGKKFQPLTQTPEQIQASELRAWNTGKIMRAYGVWPIIFGDVDLSATRENATTQMLLYQWLTVEPRAAMLAEEIGERLIPMLKIPNLKNISCEFDFSQTPFAKQLALEVASSSGMLVDRGILTPNDVREQLGYDPLPDGDARARAYLDRSAFVREAILTPNEVRAELGYPPAEGGEALRLPGSDEEALAFGKAFWARPDLARVAAGDRTAVEAELATMLGIKAEMDAPRTP
ncbi:MAG: phage portal protein [Gemmatimonadales bacterium]|nr:phage portal protein [Gemmatimonadales bacterium]